MHKEVFCGLVVRITKNDGRVWTGFIWLRRETTGVLLKHVNESLL
jgi:hypothetical protein